MSCICAAVYTRAGALLYNRHDQLGVLYNAHALEVSSVSLLPLSCCFGLRPDTQRDGRHTRGILYMTDALAHCCTICMVSWESCTMLTRWRTAVQYAWSYRSGSHFRYKGVRNDHLEMLKGATLAAAPRQQQQCWTRPCNDSSQLREIEASIGANKKKEPLC